MIGDDLISGYYFEKHGWMRDGTTYTKGEDVVKYDGVYWTLNGERVEDISELEIKLN
jgi:hypothetical protein